MTNHLPDPGSRSLVAPYALYPGAAFLVPALAVPGAGWWHVDRLVPLDGPRVRVILNQADHRGRSYRVELYTADRVVWAPTLAPPFLTVARLGHHVWCTQCGIPWGWLPVAISNAPCFS